MLRRLVWMTEVTFDQMKQKLKDANTEVEDYDGESVPIGLDEGEWI